MKILLLFALVSLALGGPVREYEPFEDEFEQGEKALDDLDDTDNDPFELVNKGLDEFNPPTQQPTQEHGHTGNPATEGHGHGHTGNPATGGHGHGHTGNPTTHPTTPADPVKEENKIAKKLHEVFAKLRELLKLVLDDKKGEKEADKSLRDIDNTLGKVGKTFARGAKKVEKDVKN